MNFFFDLKSFPSEKNEKIVVERHFGGTKVFVDGFDQSGGYIAKMWRGALLRVPKDASVKQVLVLGLGIGSCLREIRRRYKGSQITVVEWDPAMVDLAKSLGTLRSKKPPEIIVGDAAEIVPKMSRKFDLVLVDLFNGGKTEPRLASDDMISSLANVLERDGYLLLNQFKTVALIPAFEKFLTRHDAWHYRYNALGLFRHDGQGRVGEPLPKGFLHQMQSPDYLVGGWPATAKNVQLVGKSGCWGMRWHYGPLWIEAYNTDTVPEIDKTAPSRMVIWQPFTKVGKPAGWHRSWIQMNPQLHAFGDIEGKAEYWLDWTDRAQRNRKKWLKDDRYESVEVSVADFAAAYHRTGKLPSMRKDFIKLLERRVEHHGQNVHVFASRDKVTKEIISGLAVLDLPDVSQSMHLIAFILPKYEKTAVGTGLIDHWYAHCRAAGIRFPHFGLLWAPGDPNSWKGYSAFKRQFNLHLLRYPMPLLKFVKQRT